jgi:hypothetical protein
MRFDSLGAWFMLNEFRSRFLRAIRLTPVEVRYPTTESSARSDIAVLHDFGVENRNPHLTSWSARSKEGELKKVFRLHNPIVNTASGYLFDEDRALIGDYSSWSFPATAIDRLSRPGLPAKIHDDGDIVFLGTEGFYHWLIEDFPAFLQALHWSPDARVLVRRRSPQFVIDALQLLDITAESAPLVFSPRNLVFASKGSAMAPNALDVSTLREFQKRCLTSEALEPQNSKIYISRRLDGRFPKNEHEIEALVTSLGFEILNLQDMTFSEQIDRLSRATVVVGTHGAGLANIVWCRAGSARLIEITRAKFPECFARLADVASVQYSAVIDGSTEEWIVDIEELRSVLAE